ncbi:MAG TPA: saccharopine dehydrogenase NADP-binding domain-containing protein, partial [Bacillaceae bacterium]
MKIGILGSGLMGKEAARDCAWSEEVEAVGLADIDLSRAERVCRQLGSPKLKAFCVDAGNRDELAQFMGQYDVIINALFYSFNEIVAKTAVDV